MWRSAHLVVLLESLIAGQARRVALQMLFKGFDDLWLGEIFVAGAKSAYRYQATQRPAYSCRPACPARSISAALRCFVSQLALTIFELE